MFGAIKIQREYFSHVIKNRYEVTMLTKARYYQVDSRIRATLEEINVPYLFFNNFLSFLQSNRLLIYFNIEHVPYYTNDIINHT